MLGELRRFLPFTDVLVPEDAGALRRGGPRPEPSSETAMSPRILVDLREGRTPDWAALPTPAETFTALPLPWSVELAARADAGGYRKEGQLLADFLLEVVGEPARPPFARARRARRDNRRVDTPPACGGPGAADGARRHSGPRTARGAARFGAGVAEGRRSPSRTRELLSLLALRGETTREAAAAVLWPDLDERRSSNNLRITLSHLRRLLDPARRPGEAPFFVRQRGEQLRLHPSGQLNVDLWRRSGARG